MTILEEARKNIPTTDGYLDFEKFIDLATKCYARVTTQRDGFILLILSKLSNKAYEIGIAAQPQTWDGIKEALLKFFWKKSSLTTLHTELANCNQKEGEGVFDFSIRLRKTIKKLSQTYKELDETNVFYEGDPPLLAAFEDGLIDNNIRLLIKSCAGTFSDAVDLAVIEENRKASWKTRNSCSNICIFCKKDSHDLNNCIQFNKKNNVCKVCGIVGHFQSECYIKNHHNNSQKKRPEKSKSVSKKC
jgi:hypothetical protein